MLGLPGMKARFTQGTSTLLLALASGTIIVMDRYQPEKGTNICNPSGALNMKPILPYPQLERKQK